MSVLLFNRGLLFFVSTLPGIVFADDTAEIRQNFLSFQTALKEKQVDESVQKLSTKTREYYEMLSVISQTADEKELEKLAPLNRMMVETVRSVVPEKYWKDRDPKMLLKTSISKGLIARELTGDIQLGNIEINGDQATAQISRNGKASNLKLGFRKEGGEWKVHLLSFFEQANVMTELLMKRMGLKNEEFVRGLKERFGKKGAPAE